MTAHGCSVPEHTLYLQPSFAGPGPTQARGQRQVCGSIIRPCTKRVEALQDIADPMSDGQPISRIEPERWAQLPGWFVVRVLEDLDDQGVDVRPSLRPSASIWRRCARTPLARFLSVPPNGPRPCSSSTGGHCVRVRFLGSGLQLADLGMLGYTLLSADTFGELVSLWLRFGALMRPYQGTAIELLEDGRMEMIVIERDPPVYGPRMRRYCNERWLKAWAQLAHSVLGPGKHLDEVQCAYPDPGAQRAYLDAFGCLVRFDQSRTMLRFAPHVRSAHTRHANRDARQLCETYRELLLLSHRTRQGTTTAVRRLLLSHPSRLPDLAHTAQAVGTSEATSAASPGPRRHQLHCRLARGAHAACGRLPQANPAARERDRFAAGLCRRVSLQPRLQARPRPDRAGVPA